ncbi:MAG: general secretion pathway protein GspB [Halioglobus sp.]|nr:general secretion pathway protein GspB [Halioglobus sp.]MCB1708092.1 general secretion pathway protein GspB [Halioglobus sp.]MCP5122204.1 general secretion pathway protein GspB [Pseudomonadales bacterium]MCP5192251.1 general secretion pathway protein GspB [Pseudomonadales bacterium]
MSLILDALNRSRQDSQQKPGLSSVHPVDGAVAGINWLQWLLVAALAIAVLAIGWLLLDRLPQAATAVEVTAPAEPQPEPGPEPEPLARSMPGAAPVSDPAPGAAPITDAPVAPPRKPARAAPAVLPAPVDPSVAALYQQRPSTEPEAPGAVVSIARPGQSAPQVQARADSREEEVIDVELLLEKARAEMAEAGLSEHEVPFLSTLSQQTKDAVPTLMYLRHDYTGSPATSSVVINGKTLRVGGSTGGVRVEEILPDSVVLEIGGTRFRLRALNSWVNL